MRFVAILYGRTTDEVPHVSIETAKFFLDLQKRFGIRNSSIHLQAVAYYARILQQFAFFLRVEKSHFARIKIAKHFSVTSTFLQNGVPTEAGLRALECQ